LAPSSAACCFPGFDVVVISWRMMAEAAHERLE
jgi:hypothetical protein